MAKSVDDRGRGARMARRDEGAYRWYVTEEQRSHPGCIGRESDRLSLSRTLSPLNRRLRAAARGEAFRAGPQANAARRRTARFSDRDRAAENRARRAALAQVHARE